MFVDPLHDSFLYTSIYNRVGTSLRADESLSSQKKKTDLFLQRWCGGHRCHPVDRHIRSESVCLFIPEPSRNQTWYNLEDSVFVTADNDKKKISREDSGNTDSLKWRYFDIYYLIDGEGDGGNKGQGNSFDAPAVQHLEGGWLSLSYRPPDMTLHPKCMSNLCLTPLTWDLRHRLRPGLHPSLQLELKTHQSWTFFDLYMIWILHIYIKKYKGIFNIYMHPIIF